MATEICIKTRSGMYCSSSPIADCSCAKDPAFGDPYAGIPDDPAEPDPTELRDAAFANLPPKEKLARRLAKVIASHSVGEAGAQQKGTDVVRIVKLLLLSKVELWDSYVITALPDTPSRGSTHEEPGRARGA